MDLEKIDQIRHNLLENLRVIEQNKHTIPPDDYTRLINMHQSSLSIFDNLITIRKVARYDSYVTPGTGVAKHPDDRLKVVYNKDGTTKVVRESHLLNTESEPWMKQFDLNLFNPPSYTIPPQTLTSIPRIERSQSQSQISQISQGRGNLGWGTSYKHGYYGT